MDLSDILNICIAARWNHQASESIIFFCANFSDANRDDPTRFASEVGSESAKKYSEEDNRLRARSKVLAKKTF
jgi:hypothetical protein